MPAHIPALQALPDFEISAVCTTRQDSAEAATRHFGVPLAFSDAEKLAQHPDVDHFGSRVGGVTVASGYELPFGPLLLTPIARFLYQHTGVKALSEEGALGADLQFGSSSVNTVLTFLGADAQYIVNTAFGPLYPIARFHWAHQYSPGNTNVSVAYSNDPSLLSSFILPGTATSRNYFDLGAGVTLPFSASHSAFINYDSILGINHTTYNSFTAGIRFNF